MRAFAIFTIVLLSACASGGTPGPGRPATETVRLNGGVGGSLTVNPTQAVTETTLPFSIDQAWLVLPSVYDSLGIPVGVVDPATRQVGNAGFKLRRQLAGVPLSRYFNCGQTQIGPNADSYDIYLTVMSQLQPDAGGGAKLTTSLDVAARPVSFSQDYLRCSSRGELEARIGKATLERLTK